MKNTYHSLVPLYLNGYIIKIFNYKFLILIFIIIFKYKILASSCLARILQAAQHGLVKLLFTLALGCVLVRPESHFVTPYLRSSCPMPTTSSPFLCSLEAQLRISRYTY